MCSRGSAYLSRRNSISLIVVGCGVHRMRRDRKKLPCRWGVGQFLGGEVNVTKKRVLCLPIVLAGLLIGAQPAFAWQKDPDVMLDPGSLTTLVTQLLAPAATIGDTDTTPIGVGVDPVGIDGSLTSPPADPADSSPGTTFF